MEPYLPSLTINGYGIRTNPNDNNLISLTDLHKASGDDYNKRPAHWLEQDNVQEFMRAVASRLNVPLADLYETRRGRFNGGTFAHWQIALAYAKYLSPELHMAVNEVYMRYRSGDAELANEIIDKVESPEDLMKIEYRARRPDTNRPWRAGTA